MAEDKQDLGPPYLVSGEEIMQSAHRIEAQRGTRLFLFPPEVPILFFDFKKRAASETPTPDLIGPKIHINGIDGEFSPFFSGGLSLNTPEDLNEQIEFGNRTVLATNEGPVEMVQGGRATASANLMEKSKYTELASWRIPQGVTADSGIHITLFLPRFAVCWTPKSYNEDEDQKYYYGPTDENGEEYYSVIMPTDPAFLRRIEVEIS